MTPTIAIPKLGPGLLRKYLGAKYVTALKAAGAQVLWIDSTNLEEAARCDGLLIPGGDDIDPVMYGAIREEACGKQNPLRDELDPKLMKVFLPTGKPILGICRGMQMMNVYMGGTLHQDIKSIQKLNHSKAKQLGKLSHCVRLTEGSLLQRILGKEELEVNTFHHQAADVTGSGLVTGAVSPDGFAESVEWPEHRFFLGVQWHPEHLMRYEEHKKIICAFVEACKE